ncbi:2,3-dihydroxybenzoate-AMP ligase [Thermoactinomyces sp. DSM 45891]|uniref:(2,3-dihydroxybenzoyl)adenylate synthase n=1 Tax=Thermoactinomyces sp. DSM 45891 TaxID=1761907 RepID=UPI00091E9E16|nr:(2,3-dihydroxybenzoyl)adenylate synthase [Thermoactinomyces sp. DSM 45891]SFX01602.1 2,3-dihydroxybenzoate-AMP ligase [Thermoactinomyces sp. DSM 45891]
MLSGCSNWPSDFVEKYMVSRCWRGETFGEVLRERASLYGERIAITEGDLQISYLELDHRADQLASGFQKMGIRKEDRVVVQLPNTIEFFEVCFALFRLGAVPVLALPTHRYSEISYFCGFTKAVAYIIPESHAGFDYVSLATKIQEETASLKHVFVKGEGKGSGFASLTDLYDPSPMVEIQVRGEDVALFQLSGGSTGLPKFIPRTHNDYIYSLRMSNEVCQMDMDSVYLAVLPVAHNFPLSSPGVLGTLYAGGRVVLSSGSSPDEAFPLIEKEQVTITAMVPPIALIWLEGVKTRTFNFSSLKVMQVGGAKFSAEMAKRVKPAFGCTLQQVFGMAEGLVNYTRLDDPDDLIHETQGKPMSPYDEIRVVDEDDQEVPQGEAGELLTRGPYTIRGYFKAEEHNARSFTADGFYRTGDIVRLSKEDYIIVEGRNKDQINRGGEKIAAEEVENHLLAHPYILDVSIVSMPDSFLGERSCAFMIPRGNRPTPSEIRHFLQDRGLAAYKIPDRIEFVDQFPKTPLGKVSKKMLRQMIVEQMTLKKV